MNAQEQDRYGAVEKCRAVLTVWTERRQACALCRELGVSASLFSQWQDRALSGMLEALEPRGTTSGTEGPALPVSIRRLLDRRVQARELQTVGQRALKRGRPARVKAAAPSTVVP